MTTLPKPTPRRIRSFVPLAAALGMAAAAGAGAERPEADAPVEWKPPVVYSLGAMTVGLAGLVASRQGDDDPSFGNFASAFGDAPRRDDDPGIVNFVLHPLWGSETYLRARESNMGMLGSLGFSLGASVAWEYLFESWTEHPSTQDLIYTTGIGWMLGELRYRLKQRDPQGEHWWIDPIHEALEHWGIGATQTSGGDVQPLLRFSRPF